MGPASLPGEARTSLQALSLSCCSMPRTPPPTPEAESTSSGHTRSISPWAAANAEQLGERRREEDFRWIGGLQVRPSG